MKRIILIIAVVIIIIAGYLIVGNFSGGDQVIGGDKDEHGCLGAAGYTWNEEERECVREWLTGEERYQVTNFYTCEQAEYEIMESYPRQCRTPSGRLFVEEIDEGGVVGPEYYISCGCGCCVGINLEDAKERCLYKSRGESLEEMKQRDENLTEEDCANVGCSFPAVKYVYCD